MQLQDVLIGVNGTQIKVEDVLIYLKVNGAFRDTVCRLVEMQVVTNKSKELGVEVSDAEMYEFAGAKRRYAGLSRAEDMHEYCRNHGITVEHWNQVARNELLLKKTRDMVVRPATILEYFNTHKDLMKTVSVSRIVSRDAAAASDLKDRAHTGGENFSDLARRHSVEENTRMAGGYFGSVRRGMLPPKVDTALFTAALNDVVGPFSENGQWTIYRINGMREPQLNEGVKKEISERLFKVWLQKSISESKFEKPR